MGKLKRMMSKKADLESKIPGGPVTKEMKRQVGVTSEVIERDKAGFPTIVRQQVKNKFLTLASDGILTLAEATAALQLRTYADCFFKGMVPGYQEMVDSSRKPGTSVVAKLEYAQKVSDALAYLNPELRKVAVSYVIEGRVDGMGNTFTSIGSDYFPKSDDKWRRIAGKTLVIAVCRELAVHFQKAQPWDFNIAQGVTGLRAGKVRSAADPSVSLSERELEELEEWRNAATT